MKNKKKIYLRGAYNLYNFGDDLLLISTLNFFSKHLKLSRENVELYASKNFESLLQLKFDSDLELKHSVEWSDMIYRINLKLEKLRIPIKFPLVVHQLLGHVLRGEWLEQSRFLSFCQLVAIAIIIFTDIILYKLFQKALFTKEYITFLKQLDVIHYIGGGYLNERWLEVIIYEYITISLARSFNPKIKVIGTGLGLGPFKSRASLVIFKLFARKFSYLFVREISSLSIVKNLKIDVNTKVLGDDVILLLPALTRLKLEQCNYNRSSNSLTAINLKSFSDYNYNLIKLSLENYLKQVLDERSSQPEYFCFGREPGPDDRNLLEILDRYYRDSLVIRDPYEEGWRSFLSRLAGARVGIGCAYHFNIILALFNIPTVGIYSGSYYKQKIVGVMQLLSQDTLVLSLDELGLEKDLAEVVNVAINAHTSGESQLEQMYTAMKQEYVNAYIAILDEL
ncbi:polysaccharide pyruvyl transferase family protein [Chroococcidiopsis sp. FACHB-1243]|uniref:polysaccharide pyruvyl transferase family protein n=1 Tax=Chroococcidiopsis sp. [FACHB-1243] TaxID=2692781 RepID=UPI001786C904|nr:polysaccharide pyruvyl transferase family protein [Chroococcidiopsis sp. [FACHB-1243]]MBD2306779.1 polysaccharide pyruvyl transferase family protein [Chroococcidiopsis sp. [FACHB-1243]]